MKDNAYVPKQAGSLGHTIWEGASGNKDEDKVEITDSEAPMQAGRSLSRKF